MSLNGLDDVKVTKAHEAAVAEPGGWFLLKYASREEVELLGRGNGGIVEIRNSIASFEEAAPLFGFLRYRRRNVVIKYVPEECSRLIQARATVHFNAVTERFSPNDTVFSITTSKELKDSTLSAECSLHTASGSISSSTSSLRQRRLMEIAEEEEDTRTQRQSIVPEERPTTAKTLSATEPSPSTELEPTISHTTSIADPGDTTYPPGEPPSPILESTHIDEPRKSSQSLRPDLSISSSYRSTGKKIKLGPRPSLDVGASQYRPVSSLPAGLKLFSKGPRSKQGRPKSYHAPETPESTDSALLSSDTMPQNLQNPRPHISSGRPTSSSGMSIRSKPRMASNTNTPKTPTTTPEKTRLMKALEMRKKQMNTRKPPPLPTEPIPVLMKHMREDRGSEAPNTFSKAPPEIHDTLMALDELVREDDLTMSFVTSSTLKTDESDAAKPDSYPVSPAGPSEHAESTRASSISESTDDTVQDIQVNKAEPIALDESSDDTVGPSQKANVRVEEPTKDTAQADTPEAQQIVSTEPKSLDANTQGGTPGFFETPLEPESAPKTAFSETSIPTSEFNPVTRHASVMLSDISKTAEPPQPTHDLPRSKFSTQSTDAAVTPSLSTEPRLQSKRDGLTFISPKKSMEDATSIAASKRWKKKSLIEPIRTDVDLSDRSGANSANFSSDDDLMDELQDAVFHEAKPISVSKSPISPVFSSDVPSPKKKESNRFSRAFSNPLGDKTTNATLLSPPSKAEGSRSVSASAAYLNRINQQSSQAMPKKVNLGSGISQRIKALEKFSSLSPDVAAATTSTSPIPSPAFFAVRTGSLRDSKAPSIAERANSLNRNTPSPSFSRESSPEISRARDRSNSVKSRVGALCNSSSSQSPSQGFKPQPDSISVTAKIVRDPGHPFPKKPDASKDPTNYTPLDLKESPLKIDHRKAAASTPKETIKERRLSTSSKASKHTTTGRERRSSITVVKDLINQGRASLSEKRRSINLEPSPSAPMMLSPSRPPPSHTNGSPGFPKTLSLGRRSISDRNVTSPPPTASSSSSISEEGGQKSSRASRMMRRMSSSFTTNRKTKTAVSPTIREGGEPLDSPVFSSPTAVEIGDVNVQFPDTLLWKRRSMLLDSQGYLIVSPAGSDRDKTNAGAVRRYHFSSFRMPAIPDVDMQELPNSVYLDFVEGGGLQIACEDRGGQSYVLSGKPYMLIDEVEANISAVLQDAYRTWAAYGQ
ncbi:hypothetical protein BJ878DRAFT_417802 [Calycina marina]|uniref:ADF-H domain-containing protein n=1 Tax=Calycina marina TaxID=1763456 RepID=A0A9P7Z5P7_9HELO|nr:hypothetical protein BJ878DRAFT_417802 [Calycina marina]